MRIGGLAQATGATVKTIRFYEEAGLMHVPLRTDSGYRVYGTKDIERLEFIRKAKRLGMSLQEIRSILQLHDRSDPTCVHVRALLDQKLDQLDRVIGDLQEFQSELADLRDRSGTMDDCKPSGADICGIVERSELSLDAGSIQWLRSGWPQRG